jgi:hypothetical protein
VFELTRTCVSTKRLRHSATNGAKRRARRLAKANEVVHQQSNVTAQHAAASTHICLWEPAAKKEARSYLCVYGEYLHFSEGSVHEERRGPNTLEEVHFSDAWYT